MSLAEPTIDHETIRSWAEKHGLVPAEKLPARVDHEPAELELVSSQLVSTHIGEGSKTVRAISWEDFFARFDVHGLAFVYDDDSSGFHQLLQREDRSPYLRQVATGEGQDS